MVSSLAGNAGIHLGFLPNGIPLVLTVAEDSMDRGFAGSLTTGNGLTIICCPRFSSYMQQNNICLQFHRVAI